MEERAQLWDPSYRARSGRLSLARFRLFSAPSGGGFLRVSYYIDLLRVRRGLGVVVVVPVPPLVRRGLVVLLWRVLPSLLTAERCDVEVALAAGDPLGALKRVAVRGLAITQGVRYHNADGSSRRGVRGEDLHLGS